VETTMHLALLDAADVRALSHVLATVDPALEMRTFHDADSLVATASGPHPWRAAVVSAGDSAVIARLRAVDTTLPIVVVAAAADAALAATLTHAGATDLVVLGDRLRDRVRTVLTRLAPMVALREENRRLRSETGGRWALIGSSAEMRGLREQIDRVARIPRPVLLQGERGSGKELVARALHVASHRHGPLVAVNCAALPDALLESELFGHERGAYTGADRRTVGKFEQADDGTLFLDEIGAMSLPFQQKILRVVEYGEFNRVGGTAPVATSARVIGATNADLTARVADGTFLADLYDRLSFEVIRVPPLRERRDDIPALARWFLESFQAEVGTLPRRWLGEGALAALAAWSFPGNVRELKHIVERAAYHPGAPEIGPEELGLGAAPTGEGGFEAQVEAFKRQLVRSALDRSGGNQAAAARLLGLTYDQLRWYRKQLLAS
jgi:DNA-binding NtrC family response regulator